MRGVFDKTSALVDDDLCRLRRHVLDDFVDHHPQLCRHCSRPRPQNIDRLLAAGHAVERRDEPSTTKVISCEPKRKLRKAASRPDSCEQHLVITDLMLDLYEVVNGGTVLVF